jgi:F0F1-type ATP synthase assembly protein I
MTQPLYYEYAVQPGETIATIIHKLYGWSPPTRRYGEILDAIKALNPEVPNLQNLWPGTVLRVSDRAPAVAAPPGALFLSASPDPTERRQMWAMAWAERSGLLLAPGAVGMGTAANLLGEGNLALLRHVGNEYAAYKASGGRITKGQYDHRRRVLVRQFADNAGPMEKLLFGGARTQEEIRIARAGGVPYDANIQRQVGRLRQIGKAAGAGGILLGGVGVTAACYQIAHTVGQKEKNEIFVDTVMSTVVGSGLGYAVGVFVLSNPVGWGVALLLATCSTVGSLVAGKLASKAYSASGSEVDFVSGLGVDKVCSR